MARDITRVSNIDMKLEEQVCSLELAKQLKELGVKQQSIYRWTFWASPNGANLWDDQTIRLASELTIKEAFSVWDKGISAFTVAELGEILPLNKIEMKRLHPTGRFYFNLFDDKGYMVFEEDAYTEADARAIMLVYLLENKLITLPE